MPRPTPRLLGALALGAALYLYGATSEVAWLFLLAYWCWALAAAALAYEAWNRRGLVATLGIGGVQPSERSPVRWLPEPVLRTAPAEGPVFEGDTAALTVGVASTGRTRGPARLRGRAGALELDAGFGRIPGRGAGETLPLAELSRGPVRVDALVLESSDPTGMFKDSTRLPEREVAVVLPRIEPLQRRPLSRELEAALAAPRSGAGTELFGVREYRAGDPLRRIHWRLSARRGELVVREVEPPGLRTLLLVLDPAPGPAADQVARLAAAEAWASISAGGRVIAWAPGGAPSSAERSIWPVLEWLARYPSGAPSEDVPPGGLAEAVGFSAAPGPAVLDALEEVRRRGVPVRAWHVRPGEAPVEAELVEAVER